MNSSSGTGENVEIGTATAPVIGAPSSAATASGRLPISTPTRAPLPSPAAMRALATFACLGAQVGVGPAHRLTAEQRVVEHERFVAREAGAHLLGEPADRQRTEARGFRERVARQRAHRSARYRTQRRAVAARDVVTSESCQRPVSIPRTIAEVFDRVIATDPDRELLVTRSRRFSYAELDRLANRAAHALASLGVRAGDRVGGSLPNESDVVIAFHGAMRLGAVWVGINRALAPPEKQYLLTDSGTSLLLCDEPTAEQLRDADGVQVVVIGPGEAGGVWEDAMVAADDAPIDVEVDPHAPAGIAYTSGTTGYPKGAVHSQYNLMMPGAVLVATRGYDHNFRRGDSLPLTILNMQVLTTLMTGQAGGCSVIMDRVDALGVAEWIRDERVTAWNGPPAVIHSMSSMDEIAPSDLASLTEVWVGGADCPESIRTAFQEKFGMPLLTTYGLSEAPTIVTTDDLDGGHVVGASGRPLPHLDVQIIDDEVCVGPMTSGPWAGVYHLMLGYWERPEATAETLAGGVLHTGDLGFIDDDGYLHIRDRKSLVIIRGGANVYPAEVERVVHELDGVAASRGGRCGRRASRRARDGRGRARSRRGRHRRGAHRALPRQPRQVQGAGALGLRRRLPAQLHEQDPTPRARPLLRVTRQPRGVECPVRCSSGERFEQ